MSPALESYQEAVNRTQVASFDLAAAVFRLTLPRSSALAVPDAEAGLCLAARDLARAVDELPMDRRPKGWDQ